MPIIDWPAALTLALREYFGRLFIRADPTGRFTAHIKANGINRTALGVVAGFSGLAGISRIPSVAAYLASHGPDWASSFSSALAAATSRDALGWVYQTPLTLFAMLSALSFLSAYNNYVIIINNNVVMLPVRLFSLCAVCLSAAAVIAGVFWPDTVVTKWIPVSAYVSAVVVSWCLASYLKHEAQEAGVIEPPMASKMTRQWIPLNLVIAVILAVLAVTSIPSSSLALLADEVRLNLLSLHILLYLVLTVLIVFSSLRAGVFLHFHKYADEIDSFNVAVLNGPRDKQSRTGDGSHGPKVLVLFIALTRMIRLESSIASGVLVGFASGSFLYGVSAFFFLAFSFALNDLCDDWFGKDRFCHPSRSLPSGAVSRLQALMMAAGLIFVGLLTAAIVHPVQTLGMLLVIYGVSVAYSLGLKLVAPLVATPLWCAALTILVSWPSAMEMSYVAMTFLFLYARELLLDFRDVATDDQFATMRSLPSLLGQRTHWVVLALIVCASFVGFASSNIVVAILMVSLAALYGASLAAIRDGRQRVLFNALAMRPFMLGLLFM